MKRLLTSCLGLGLLPLMPGTWASIPVCAVFALTVRCEWSAKLAALAMAALVLAGGAVCIAFAPAIIARTGKSDPREIVADELAGQAVAFLPIPLVIRDDLSNAQLLTITLAGFVLFRVFDIWKPWLVGKLEKLPAGYGILCDDLMAGLFAAVILSVAGRLCVGG